jgi:hypothetical protein
MTTPQPMVGEPRPENASPEHPGDSGKARKEQHHLKHCVLAFALGVVAWVALLRLATEALVEGTAATLASLGGWGAVAALATVAYCVAAFFQWRAIAAQGSAAERQLAAMDRQARDAERTLRLQQRPWVLVERVQGGPHDGPEDKWPLVIIVKNHGRGPAMDVHVSMAASFELAGVERSSSPMVPILGRYVLGPGQGRDLVTQLPQDPALERLFDQGATLFIRGEITYSDQFGEAGGARFRFHYVRGFAFSSSETGNHAW